MHLQRWKPNRNIKVSCIKYIFLQQQATELLIYLHITVYENYSRCLLFNKLNCQESGPGSLCKTCYFFFKNSLLDYWFAHISLYSLNYSKYIIKIFVHVCDLIKYHFPQQFSFAWLSILILSHQNLSNRCRTVFMSGVYVTFKWTIKSSHSSEM